MEDYQWGALTPNRIPLPHENFDQFFPDYNDLDNMMNQTLTGLQDLDVPSGYGQEMKSEFKPGHDRKTSGTAIFGFVEHTKDFSISGLNDLYKKPTNDILSISPGELKLNNSVPPPHELDLNFNQAEIKPILLMEQDEFAVSQTKGGEDLIVTNNNPKSYKFPPPASSPIPHNQVHNLPRTASSPIKKQYQSVNNYSVKYLQELNNQPYKTYVDDIEPLLDDNLQQHSTPFNDNTYKYVPIPEQEPKVIKKPPPPPQSHAQLPQSQVSHTSVFDKNPYLAPPPPTLSIGSPEWQSSPEPLSPSPSHKLTGYPDCSPVHPQLKNANVNFYAPQFFSEPDDFNLEELSDDVFFQQQEYRPSSHVNQGCYQPLAEDKLQNQPTHTIQSVNHMSSQLQSSPIHGAPATFNNSIPKHFTSPLRNTHTTNDDTVDANATITQLTPLKANLVNTPSRKQVQLEWSPIISPNIKGSKDVRLHIQQSTQKRIKKTSLLPPGELDQYWDGPDEDKTYTCTYQDCGKKFTRRYNVRSHIQTHLSDRPFACSYCPKKFVRQHDLNRHVKGHLEARQFKCPCGKEFARLDALKKHKERNICVGGSISSTNNGVIKPRKSKNDILDEFTSNKLVDQITSNISDEDS